MHYTVYSKLSQFYPGLSQDMQLGNIPQVQSKKGAGCYHSQKVTRF